jgi:hypothetical protein
MTRESWATPTDTADAWARAGGRRRYNRLRQDLAGIRRIQLVRLARSGEGHRLLDRGFQAEAARRFGVSPATICRDVKTILQGCYERGACPGCGGRRVPGGYQL